MAGIYIHVPFCKTRCIYCDFFTQTKMDEKNLYIDAICKEINLRQNYIDKESIQTIYFGGGTPSQLSKNDLLHVLNQINKTFDVDRNAEITLEANPDDLSIDYLKSLISIGFNRLSIGIQSFDDNDLKFLNRRHSSQKAKDAVKNAQQVGFNNISIDLMYGLPNSSFDIWKKNLDITTSLNIQHVSSYHLIYEEGTKLFTLLERGKVRSVEEETSVDMFKLLIDTLSENRFQHYEISNFGKPNYLSKHNSSYWNGSKYLGLGPSAHSYNGINRCWNISSIPLYIKGITDKNPSIEEEILDIKTQYNDYILTGLRTMWGINRDTIKEKFGESFLLYCDQNLQKHIQSGDVIFSNNQYKISKQGIFISDGIMSDLMFID